MEIYTAKMGHSTELVKRQNFVKKLLLMQIV